MSLLEAKGARVVIDGAVVIESLTFATRGDRVIVIGDAEGLMAVLTGAPRGTNGQRARLAGGELALQGHDVSTGAHRAIAGLAPRDLPLWNRWSVQDYLVWNARLMGYRPRAARARALAVLELLGLQDGRKRRLSTLTLVAKRALALAAALLNEPKVVVIESPFEEVDAQGRAYLEGLVMRATTGRAAIVSLAELANAPEALLQQASDAVVMRDGRLLAHDTPGALLGGARLFEVAVARGADALRAELANTGLELSGGPVHFVLRLPEGKSPSDLLAAAARARAAVLTCAPMF
ncbi:MAG TPA: hypothetical protein VFB62_28300 [Polyangiaceae bacterium]|jgi:ABC-2 type transport system ATP-binding protein|nr:hypothetical protein [Polyangiaceae bacterium]